MRRVRTRVLPEPAPARMHRGLASVVTARAWAGLRPWSNRSASIHSTVTTGCDKNADGRAVEMQQHAERPQVAIRRDAVRSPRGRTEPLRSDTGGWPVAD